MQIKPLHICIVTNEFPALTETFITTKVLELSKRGHRITVVRNQQNKTINSSHVKLVEDAGIKILQYEEPTAGKGLVQAFFTNPLFFIKAFSFSPAVFKKNYKSLLQMNLLTKDDFDIIHFEFSGLAVGYLQTIKKLLPKVVVSCRGTAEKVKPVSEPARKEQLRKLFENVDAIHCVSDDMADTILPYCKSADKIFVNRPSIDATVFNRSEAHQATDEVLQILSIGRFTFQKGYLIGLMAMKKLKEKGVKFKWKIVGDGPQKEEILYYIHSLHLNDCVELLGKKNRDEILALYNSNDVYLLCSVYEGIANVCLEAMSMQLPVVATKSGGMEEVIEHGVNGLLCELYNPDSIADNLEIIATNRDLIPVFGANARATILQRFTIQQQADVFEREYNKLVNPTKPMKEVNKSKNSLTVVS
ncbi:MAG TPA: glycosyltransferase family 4 protein [Segetibacter sp.]